MTAIPVDIMAGTVDTTANTVDITAGTVDGSMPARFAWGLNVYIRSRPLDSNIVLNVVSFVIRCHKCSLATAQVGPNVKSKVYDA